MKQKKLNIMAIGAHPDDCEFMFGGTAVKFIALGHRVMFMSMTNGCSGHHLEHGPAMAARRFSEIQAVSELTGIEYKMTDIPDGSLTADLRYRDLLMREIRAFEPDIIFTHRPNDYHPDHRSVGTLVMDCSYLAVVPHVTPGSPPLKKAPYIFYMFDKFNYPCPFVPDIAVSVNDVMDKKTAMLDCHASQVYEWLPWVGGYIEEVPAASGRGSGAKRLQWLKTYIGKRDAEPVEKCGAVLDRRYGKEKSAKVSCCEAFQLSEYGAHISANEMDEIFPL
jgi:LmbE family N-acetylglucosaminyl deacetylase